MALASWALIVGAFALVFIALRARAGRLGRQSVVGLRTKTTMASDEAWSAAHHVVWPWLIVAASIMVASAVLVLAVEPTEDTSAAILLGGVAVAAVPFGIGARRGQQAARNASAHTEG